MSVAGIREHLGGKSPKRTKRLIDRLRSELRDLNREINMHYASCGICSDPLRSPLNCDDLFECREADELLHRRIVIERRIRGEETRGLDRDGYGRIADDEWGYWGA